METAKRGAVDGLEQSPAKRNKTSNENRSENPTKSNLDQELTRLPDFEFMSVRAKNNQLEILDQSKLPNEEIWLPASTPKQMYEHIQQLRVRGAPLIGCCAALTLALTATQNSENSENSGKLRIHAEYLKSARPTAVNLGYACDLMASIPDPSAQNLISKALEIRDNEIRMCDSMSNFGASLVSDGDGILTHCNTGSLATFGVGTALGVIRAAHRAGKKIHVYVDETRPLLQGGRLTTYELQKEGIPYTLICDNMAGVLMAKGKIQRVFVGADRIATNGDFANKIGTYTVAVLAKHHNIPFHTVAPVSTVDFNCHTGSNIPIEQRSSKEVMGAFGVSWAPSSAQVYNPAFDVTPIELVSSVILDSGIHTPDMIKDGSLFKLKAL